MKLLHGSACVLLFLAVSATTTSCATARLRGSVFLDYKKAPLLAMVMPKDRVMATLHNEATNTFQGFTVSMETDNGAVALVRMNEAWHSFTISPLPVSIENVPEQKHRGFVLEARERMRGQLQNAPSRRMLKKLNKAILRGLSSNDVLAVAVEERAGTLLNPAGVWSTIYLPRDVIKPNTGIDVLNIEKSAAISLAYETARVAFPVYSVETNARKTGIVIARERDQFNPFICEIEPHVVRHLTHTNEHGILYRPITTPNLQMQRTAYEAFQREFWSQYGLEVQTLWLSRFRAEFDPITPVSDASARSKYEDFLQAVVVIRSSSGLGSGFFVNKNGDLITNAHVVGDDATVSVRTRSGSTFLARVKNVDIKRDLAWVVVSEGTDSWLLMGRAKDVSVGDDVIAIGNPIGETWSVSRGIISAFRKTPTLNVAAVQTDTPINPGNSGGPLVALKTGKVIGVNSRGYSKHFTEGLNFAVSASEIGDAFPDLKLR